MLKKTLQILFGVALIPFCIGFTWQTTAVIFTVRYKPDAPYYFVAGGLAYLVSHLLFKKPLLAYVFSHELTHAFFALLFGGSIKSFHASERGGRVTITKSNVIITLAPYFFPLYTFIALLLYGAARAADVRGAAIDVLVFLAGATFAFHLILTLVFLQTDQSDIRENGALFSYPLIYLFNTIFAAFILHIYLADNMDFLLYLAGGIIKSTGMISSTAGQVYTLVRPIVF